MLARAIAEGTGYAAAGVVLTALALLALAGPWPAMASAEPPEQGKIAFVRAADGHERGAGDIWVMNDDGSGLTPLTEDGRDSSPAWSPDGKRIAFTRWRRARADSPVGDIWLPVGDIWVMNADGSDPQNLTRNPDDPPHEDASPTWSPDGERIAFNRPGTDGGIWVMNADGSDVTRLTSTWDARYPAWSPDGERIAFGGLDGISVMNADGSDETRLTSSTAAGGPAWSPDGERIAFTETFMYEPGKVQVWESFLSVVSADGGDVTWLFESAWSPTWSPDGRRIAFTAGDYIWAMNADRSCLTPLASGPYTSPAWYPLSPPSDPQRCFTLSVSTTGTGKGGVSGAGVVSCASTGLGTRPDQCTLSFAAATELTLRATASGFAGWGGACTGTGPCRLTMDGDREVTAHFGTPRLLVRARPRQRRVGPDRRRVRYRFVARNVGDGPTGRIRLCARDPQRQVRVLGKRCVTRQIPPGVRRQRAVKVRIRPAAQGELTRIRLIARLGPGVKNQQTVARLRVRR